MPVLFLLSPSHSDREQYRVLLANEGQDAAAKVRMALWCEAHGMQDERHKHLQEAVEADPADSVAHGLLGQLKYQGKWQAPEAANESIQADAQLWATLAEYNAKREGTPNKPNDQWKLGRWCEDRGLDGEAKAHFTAVTRLAPKRHEAWLKLGCKQYGGQWLNEEQIAAQEAERQAQKKADGIWQPLLESCSKTRFGSKQQVEETRHKLGEVTDPRAVPSIWRVFGKGKPDEQAIATQLLGQIDAPSASEKLVELSLSGKTADVREKALNQLYPRDPRDYLHLLIQALIPTASFQMQPMQPGVLTVEGKQFNLKGIFLPGTQLNGSIATVNAYNAAIHLRNAPLVGVLGAITGVKELGDDQDAWMSWWSNQQGYTYSPPEPIKKPTVVRVITPVVPVVRSFGNSCFAAGSLVRTLTGPMLIEQMQVGDQVLTQDTQTAALSFQPVVAVFHNKPTETFRIGLGTETIVATGIHRLWRVGKGWTMTRDLKTGDVLRTLGGVAQVTSLETDQVQPVFNLEVAEGKCFFVGNLAVLAHDNSLVKPTPQPFDVLGPTLAVETSQGRN